MRPTKNVESFAKWMYNYGDDKIELIMSRHINTTLFCSHSAQAS